MRRNAEVTLLGQFQVLVDDRAVEITSAKERALLTRLALVPGRVVRTDTLIEAIWPDGAAPDDPGRALRYRVWHLRNLLEPDRSERSEGTLVLTQPTGYLLALDPGAVDAVRFEAEWARSRFLDNDAQGRRDALAALLETWHPPSFAGLSTRGPLADAAVRLDRLRVSVLGDRIAADIALGRGAELVPELEQIIAAHPFDERLQGHLMVALYRSGRQADALAVYTSTRDLLVEELGVEPGPEMRDLERRILEHDTDLVGIRRAVAAVSQGAIGVTPSRHRCVPELIGRQSELDALTQALAEVTAGPNLVSVVVVGEAGIGKTTVLRAFAELCAESATSLPMLVIDGRCDEAVSVPLQPFRTIVERLVATADQDMLDQHTMVHGNVLSLMAPAFGRRAGTHSRVGVDDATERFLLFEAVADIIGRSGERQPLVLMLDDLHWAEPTALELLRHVVRVAPDARCLIVASTREPDETASPDLRSALADLARSRFVRIELGGFGLPRLAELIGTMSRDHMGVPAEPDPEVIAALEAETAGNPLFATHLVRHWLDSGRFVVSGSTLHFGAPTATAVTLPQTLRDIVWARLRSLGPDAPAVLSAATVLGPDVAESLLVELVDATPDVVASVLDAATRAGILTDSHGRAGTLRFTHALVAKAAGTDLPGPRRRRLHERAARALEREGGRSTATLTRIAYHWDNGASPSDALRSALDAGDAALSTLAAAEAVHWYRRALDHTETLRSSDAHCAAVLVRLGKGLQRAGDASALATLLQASELARRCNDRELLVQAVEAAGSGFIRLGDFAPTYHGLVDSALAVTPPEDVAMRARLLALLATALMASGDEARRERAAFEALALADASDDPLLIARLAPEILRALWTPGTARVRADLLSRAVAAADGSGDPYVRFVVNVSAFNTAVCLGDATRAKVALSTIHDVVGGHSEPRMRWIVSVIDTFVATMAGRFPEAERLADASVELGTVIGEPEAFSVYASQYFVNGTFAGRYAEILPVIDQVLASGEKAVPFQLAHAIACAVSGRIPEATAVLGRGRSDGFAAVPRDLLWLTSIVGYTVLAIELGDNAAAVELFALLEPYADQVAFNGATSQGPVAAYLGRLASMLGRHDEADRLLHDALTTAEMFGWEYHRASTLVCLAESRLRRTGSIDDYAQRLLTDAQLACDEHGIGWWAHRVCALRDAYDADEKHDRVPSETEPHNDGPGICDEWCDVDEHNEGLSHPLDQRPMRQGERDHSLNYAGFGLRLAIPASSPPRSAGNGTPS